MRRIVLLGALAMLMAAMVLASALPALAAPPTLTVSCTFGNEGIGMATTNPREYKELNAFYRDCVAGGNTGARELTPNPGPPAR